jgi:hypothetical protein
LLSNPVEDLPRCRSAQFFLIGADPRWEIFSFAQESARAGQIRSVQKKKITIDARAREALSPDPALVLDHKRGLCSSVG